MYIWIKINKFNQGIKARNDHILQHWLPKTILGSIEKLATKTYTTLRQESLQAHTGINKIYFNFN